jgi:dihydrofolate reductase
MFNLSNAFVARDLEQALECPAKYGYSSDIWIIGGGQIYKEAIEKDIPDRLYISEMQGHWESDPVDSQTSSSTVTFVDQLPDEVVTFPRVNWQYYKALYIENFEDHTLKILSKNSLDVL